MTPTRTFRRAAARGAVAALAATTLLAACGDDDDDASSSDTTEAASETTVADTTTEAPAGEIAIDGAWGRTSPAVATAGAVYMQITNDTDTDDALVGAAVDPSVAATVELHETVAAGEGDEGGMGATTMGTEMATTTAMGTDTTGMTDTTGGMGTEMMEMRPVEAIELPAGETVSLEPGGYHIMLIDLAEPLTVGTTIDVTLTFETAAEQVVTVEIRDTEP
jgi:copper(I)-binding protein